MPNVIQATSAVTLCNLRMVHTSKRTDTHPESLSPIVSKRGQWQKELTFTGGISLLPETGRGICSPCPSSSH